MVGLLIVNADDFGASTDVNAAVAAAYRDGVLTSASLMVTGAAAGEAVQVARDHPQMAVGLHLALTDAVPALVPYRVSALADLGGRFSREPVRAGIRYFVLPAARRQLEMEIEAQFDLFAQTGLPLSHIDGHQHLHLHPAILPHAIRQAELHGAYGIRVPRESFLDSLRRDRVPYQAATAFGHAVLRVLARRRLRSTRLAHCDVVIGSMMSGCMAAAYAVDTVLRLEADSAEIFFHPSIGDSGDRYGPNPGDLQALLDPELRHSIVRTESRLGRYSDLVGGHEAAHDCA